MFTPLTVKDLTLRNRFVMPGMQRSWCIDGVPAPRLAEYYRSRAAGGTGLIISEACAIDHPSATRQPVYAWLTERSRGEWARCVDAVRGAGGEMFMQLWHEGAVRPEGGDGPHSEYPTVSPSGLHRADERQGRALTTAELDDIEAAFVRSALIAKSIGASGVEVHGCHGFLIDQFLWKATNLRDDGYGGDDLRDRLRFPVRIVEAIRRAVGDELPISFRFSQWKESDYSGRIVESPDELALLIRTLEDAGVDMFHVSTRRFWTAEWPDLEPDLGLAGWTKRFATKPVSAVGSLGLDIDVLSTFDGVQARATGEAPFRELRRRFLRGDFDLVSVGRGHIADPEWVAKVQRGAIAELRTYDAGAVEQEAEELDAALAAAAAQ